MFSPVLNSTMHRRKAKYRKQRQALRSLLTARMTKHAKKDFDLDKADINLKIFIRKQIDSLKEQLNKVQEQVSTSSQLATVAVDVPNMEEYVTLLERRHHFMKIMFLTYAEKEDHGGAAELGLENINIADFNRTETDGKDLQAVIDKVNNWLQETEAKTPSVASSSSGLDGSSQIVEQKIAWGEKLDKYSKEIVTEWGKFSWRCKLAFKHLFGMLRIRSSCSQWI